MAAKLKEIVGVYQNLKRVWDTKPPNLDKAGELLSKLKVFFVIRTIYTEITSENSGVASLCLHGKQPNSQCHGSFCTFTSTDCFFKEKDQRPMTYP